MAPARHPRPPLAAPTALLAAATLLLAGCLGGPAPEAAQAPGAGTAPGGASEGAPPTAGSSAGTGNASAEAGADGAAPAPERTEPISWDGSFGTWACVPTGPGSCASFVGLGEHETRLEFATAPSAVQAELTWDARPGMEQLSFTLNLATSCGDRCWSHETVASAEGPSPLALAHDGIAAAENATVVLLVGSPSRTPPPMFLLVNVDQPFHVEGSATYRG